jgi:hypothetical protein
VDVEGTGILCLIVGVIGVGLMFRLLAGNMDHQRIRDYIQSHGGRVLSCAWSPFGRGWFGEKSDRIYEVSYLDKDGNQHQATCKTSMWTGVYWTEDRIVLYASRQPEAELEEQEHFRATGNPWDRLADRSPEELEEENRRLRAELERLKKERQ